MIKNCTGCFNVSYFYAFVLSFFILCYFFINTVTITDGHNWGCDFAQYIFHAENILSGKEYDSGFLADNFKGVGYPPGYPLVILPVLKYFGRNFVLLKFINVISWFVFIAALYPIYSRKFGYQIAVLGSIFLLTSPFFFVFKQNVISDIVFLPFLTGAILFLTLYLDNSENPLSVKGCVNFFLGLMLMVFAFLVRNAGGILFAATIFYFFYVRKQIKAGFLILSVFLVTFFLNEAFCGVSSKYFNQFVSRVPERSFALFLDDLNSCFSSIFDFFRIIPLPEFGNVIGDFSIMLSGVQILFLLSIFIIMIRKILQRRCSLIECFFFFYIIGVLVWSTAEGGMRFIFPVVGFVLVFLLDGIKIFYDRISRQKNNFDSNFLRKVFLIVLIWLNLRVTVLSFDSDGDMLHKTYNQELFAWVKGELNDDIYMFIKPRALALMTGKKGFFLPSYDRFSGDIYQLIKDRKVKYLILHKLYDRKWILKFGKDLFGRLVWENAGYQVLKCF